MNIAIRPAAFVARLPEAVTVAAVVLIAVGIPLAVALATGAFDAPHNDDWAFYRIAATFADSGELELLNWNEMTLIGHLVWAAPFQLLFGTSLASVHAAGTVAAAISLVAAYGLYRQFVDPGHALFGVAVLGFFPVFALLSTTFMTDLAALAPQLICVALGVVAIEAEGRRRTLWLALALAAGFAGFSIREVAILAPLAVLSAHAIAASREDGTLRALAWTGGTFLVACGALYLWRRGLPAGGSLSKAEFSSRGLVSNLVSAVYTLALGALPALALAARVVWASLRRPLGLIVAAGMLLAGLVKIVTGTSDAENALLLGGYLAQRTITSNDQLGTQPTVLPDPLWWPVVGIALIAGCSLAGFVAVQAHETIKVLRRRGPSVFEPRFLVVALFGAFSVTPLIVRLLLGGAIYDRYLLPVLAVLILVLVKWARSEAGIGIARFRAALALGLSIVLSFVFVYELRGLEGGRWDAGMQLVKAGHSRQEIDAGLQWVGVNNSRLPGDTVPMRWAPPDAFYLQEAFSGVRNCAAISTSLRGEPWMTLIGVEHYSTMLGLREHELYLYRNEKAC